ncbi:MAG: hypothetical protein IPI69_13890 [Bacteroidales bacterium]|nr:hypothetical protein [Bacteroidales bacterium]
MEVDWKDYIDITTITKPPGYDILNQELKDHKFHHKTPGPDMPGHNHKDY